MTVGGVPSHLKDEDILDFLSVFGEFYSDQDKITNRTDQYGVEKGERVYLCKKLNIDILSSYSVYGHNLTFRYPGQPHTCILCHRRGHGASECPNIPDNRQLRHPARDGNNTESAQGNSENQQVDNSYAGKIKSGTNYNIFVSQYEL